MCVPRARLIVARCPAVGTTTALAREEAAHAKARRLAPGDRVTLIDGSGVEAHGRLVRLTAAAAEVFVEEVAAADPREIDLSLFVSALRLERLSWVTEKATELSARRVVVVVAERTQKFRAGAARVARLARVAREAAKQCESACWPELSGPVPLREVWSVPARHRLFLDFEGELFPSRLAPGPTSLLLGPEGGWTETERVAARESDWLAVRLPAGKLRAETAAIAAMVLARAALGASRV